MGFSGGGSNILKAHKHSAAVQDGGTLDMDNVTQAELTAGDVIFSNGLALQRLAIGAATNSLVVNGAATAPEWAASAASASCTIQNITPTTGQTTTSSSYVDVTNSTITLPSRSGFAYLSGMAMVACSTAPANIGFGIYEGGALQTTQTVHLTQAGGEEFVCVSYMCALSGQDVTLQWRISGGTATMVNSSLLTSRFQSFEVG